MMWRSRRRSVLFALLYIFSITSTSTQQVFTGFVPPPSAVQGGFGITQPLASDPRFFNPGIQQFPSNFGTVPAFNNFQGQAPTPFQFQPGFVFNGVPSNGFVPISPAPQQFPQQTFQFLPTNPAFNPPNTNQLIARGQRTLPGFPQQQLQQQQQAFRSVPNTSGTLLQTPTRDPSNEVSLPDFPSRVNTEEIGDGERIRNARDNEFSPTLEKAGVKGLASNWVQYLSEVAQIYSDSARPDQKP